MTGNAITHRARAGWEVEQVDLIRDTVARDCTEPELHQFLELAARYKLDPFAGHIYAARIPGQTGARGRIAHIVSRDGFLHIAHRDPSFAGIESDVVRAGDTFKKSQTADGPVVEHSYTTERGDILGAWAIVHITGRKPTYFYAPMDEYRGSPKTPWGNYPSAMIEKVAQAVALRRAFSISGHNLVGEGELDAVLAQPTATVVEEPLDWGDDEALAERLRLLVGAAREVDAGSWREAKLRLKLAGLRSYDDRLGFAHSLEAWITKHGGEIPDPPEAEVVE